MTATVRCTTLTTFTQFVSGYGMVHGSPEADDAKNPVVPEHVVQRFVDEGYVEAEGYLPGAIIADGEQHDADLSQLDHDGDGRPGGSISATGDDIPALRKLYKEVVGKAAFNGWDADTLRAKISAAQTGNEGAPI